MRPAERIGASASIGPANEADGADGGAQRTLVSSLPAKEVDERDDGE